jgi:hypothetical protein
MTKLNLKLLMALHMIQKMELVAHLHEYFLENVE